MIKKLYYQFKTYNIKIAREKAERKGVAFDEKSYIKRQDASLPILLYYGFIYRAIPWFSSIYSFLGFLDYFSYSHY